MSRDDTRPDHSDDTGAPPPLQLALVPVTPFSQNCSLLVCTRTGRAAAFDTGGDLDLFDEALAGLGAKLE